MWPFPMTLIVDTGGPTPPPPANNLLEICNPNAFSVSIGRVGRYVQNTGSICNAITSPGLDGGDNTDITFV